MSTYREEIVKITREYEEDNRLKPGSGVRVMRVALSVLVHLGIDLDSRVDVPAMKDVPK